MGAALLDAAGRLPWQNGSHTMTPADDSLPEASFTDEPTRPRDDREIRMAGYLARVATGPHLSKDLAREEARDGMELILRGQVDAAQAAVFLIALRMKRESHDELCGVLDALRAVSVRAIADVDHLVDLADPYNGFIRHAPAVPFVPAVLAACGVPCVIHGIREIGPKWGVTPHRILQAAGISPARLARSPEQAARAVEDIGWAYVDQTSYCPELARMARLRTLIVKRPCLSLVEKLIQPVRARGENHLWVGYAHRGYPEILAALAREFGYDSMLAVRGVESGVLTSLTGNTRGMRYAGSAGQGGGAEFELESIEIAAREAVDSAEVRAPELPEPEPATPEGSPKPARPDPDTLDRWAAASAERGQDALAGKSGPTRDMLVLGVAAILRHLGRVEKLAEGAEQARAALDSGEAGRRFQAMGDSGS